MPIELIVVAHRGERGDGDQAAIPRREIGPSPQVAKTTSLVSCTNFGATVPNSSVTARACTASEATAGRRGLTARNARCRSSARCRPARRRRARRRRSASRSRSPGAREGPRPRRADTVVERPAQVAGKLRRLSGRDQDRDGHEAAVAWRQLGPPPHVAEQHVVGERRQAGAIVLLQPPDGLAILRQSFRTGCSDGVGCGDPCGMAPELRPRRYLIARRLPFPSITHPSITAAVNSRCVIDTLRRPACQCLPVAGMLTTSPVSNLLDGLTPISERSRASG